MSQVVLVIHANLNAHGQIESTQVARESDVRGKFQGPIDQEERRIWWSILEQASLLVGREFESIRTGEPIQPGFLACTECGHPDAATHGLWRIDRLGRKMDVSPATIGRQCVLLRIVKLLESGALRQQVTFNFDRSPDPKFADCLTRDEDGEKER